MFRTWGARAPSFQTVNHGLRKLLLTALLSSSSCGSVPQKVELEIQKINLTKYKYDGSMYVKVNKRSSTINNRNTCIEVEKSKK